MLNDIYPARLKASYRKSNIKVINIYRTISRNHGFSKTNRTVYHRSIRIFQLSTIKAVFVWFIQHKKVHLQRYTYYRRVIVKWHTNVTTNKLQFLACCHFLFLNVPYKLKFQQNTKNQKKRHITWNIMVKKNTAYLHTFKFLQGLFKSVQSGFYANPLTFGSLSHVRVHLTIQLRFDWIRQIFNFAQRNGAARLRSGIPLRDDLKASCQGQFY